MKLIIKVNKNITIPHLESALKKGTIWNKTYEGVKISKPETVKEGGRDIIEMEKIPKKEKSIKFLNLLRFSK